MTSPEETNSPAPLPKPVVKKMRWPYPAIWIVPILALLAAGYYFYDNHRQQGVEITITFADGSGVKPGETAVTVHGVEVGKVSNIALSEDQQRVLLHVTLAEANSAVAKADTQFWIVRPDITNGNISGLGTIVSGPHIEALPGNGAATKEFTGREEPPLVLGDGKKIILHTPHLLHLQANSPVYFRGIQTGVVQDVRFNADATEVNVTLFIWGRYAPLVRADSEFWAVSGADVKGNLLSGLELKLGSLRSLLSGGVAFASPANRDGVPSAPPAEEGMQFVLHDEAKKEWSDWSPKIRIESDSAAIQDNTSGMKPDEQHPVRKELQQK